MSSIAAYKDAVDTGALVVQDLAVMAVPWVPGVTVGDDLFDTDGVVADTITNLGLISVGEIDQKAGVTLTPDVKFNDIMGYGARAPRRRILQSEGLDIDLTPQEARNITYRMLANLRDSDIVETASGGWRATKLAGIPPQYWSLFVLGLDSNDATGNDILPWWFIPKVGLDKGGKQQLQMDNTQMAPASMTMFQDGDNLYQFGIEGQGWTEIAADMGFASTATGTTKTVTITGSPTGGTFTLTVGGQTTAAIPFNATATNVQAALTALSTVGTGKATVTGSAGGPYTVVLAASVTGTLTASGSNLTGGTSPSVTVS